MIIILFILSAVLILIGCKTNRFCIILPGHNIRNLSPIELSENFTNRNKYSIDDSLFDDMYYLPLTR